MAIIAIIVAAMVFIAIRASLTPSADAGKVNELLGYVSGGGVAVGLLGALYQLKVIVVASLQMGHHGAARTNTESAE
jgi:hypothetical protein